MWTSEAFEFLARERQAELLRIAADVHLELAAQAGRERRIGHELRGALQGLRRCLSAVAALRRLMDRTGAKAAPGSMRS